MTMFMYMYMYTNIGLTFLIASLITTIILLYALQQQHKWRKSWSSEDDDKEVPPGELGLPWIGETMEFYKALQTNSLFEEFIAPRIQKHGNTFKTRLMGCPTVVVNGAEANRFFLSNEFKLVVSSWPSSSVQLMGVDSIMEKTGEQHRVIRSIFTPCLGKAGLEGLVPKIFRVVNDHLVQNWGSTSNSSNNSNNQHEEKIIPLYRTAKFLIFRVTCECLLGMETKEGLFECFEKVLQGVFAPMVNVPGTSFWRAKRARAEINNVLLRLVREKRKQIEQQQQQQQQQQQKQQQETSLLSRLVGALIRGEITEEEVVDNVVLLIFAAHDTTSFAIAMTFKMLAQHPHCYSLLLQEHIDIMRAKQATEEESGVTMEDVMKMKYTWQVARESMRLFPPIFGSFRRAITDIKFDGYTIPKGWKVLWTSYGTHLNEEYFRDPMRFDPSRFEENVPLPPYVFVAFGGGPRVCAGYQLAKLNILIFVHLVVTRYDWSLVQPNEPVIMDPLPFPSQGMPLRVSPKH